MRGNCSTSGVPRPHSLYAIRAHLAFGEHVESDCQKEPRPFLRAGSNDSLSLCWAPTVSLFFWPQQRYSRVVVRENVQLAAVILAVAWLSHLAASTDLEVHLMDHGKSDRNYRDSVGQDPTWTVYTDLRSQLTWEDGHIGPALNLGNPVIIPYLRLSGPAVQRTAESQNPDPFTVSWWWRPAFLGGGAVGCKGLRWPGRMETHLDHMRSNGWRFHGSETGAIYCGLSTKCRLYRTGLLIATKADLPTPIRWLGFQMTHWFNGCLDDVRFFYPILHTKEVA